MEGTAKYIELAIWRAAAESSAYEPLEEIRHVSDFKQYRGFERQWSREVAQIRRVADDSGDGRFYYSGMAQAYLLDQLMPDWKQDFKDSNTTLEGLLKSALSQRDADA